MKRLLLAVCLLWPGVSEAARVVFTGFEWGSSAEVNTVSGTVNWVTSPITSGTYAFQVNPTTTGTAWTTIAGTDATGSISVSVNAPTLYTTFSFRYATKPASGDEDFFRNTTSVSTTIKLALRLTSGGLIAAYDTTPTIMATGSTVLAENTWYRIEVLCGTGAAANWEVKINGISEISGTGNLNTTNHGLAGVFGKRTNYNGNTVNYYYDDIWFDNADYLGAHSVIALVPNANGSTMQWTGGTGASDYTTVDEVPPSNTDYVQSTAQNDVALFDLFDSSTQSISGTIHSVVALVRVAEAAAGTSVYNTRLRVNATNSDNSTLDPGASAVTNGRYVDTDPSDAGAWTTGDVDDIEVGGVDSGTNVLRLTASALMVSYTAAVAGRRRVVLVN